MTEIEADGWPSSWGEATLQLNLHYLLRVASKIQISPTWISNCFGVAAADFQETLVQIQYV